MTNKLSPLRELLRALEDAVKLEKENAILRQQLIEQSQVIAALVAEHRGHVHGDTWDAAHKTEDFRPYRKRLNEYGVEITCPTD